MKEKNTPKRIKEGEETGEGGRSSELMINKEATGWVQVPRKQDSCLVQETIKAGQMAVMLEKDSSLGLSFLQDSQVLEGQAPPRELQSPSPATAEGGAGLPKEEKMGRRGGWTIKGGLLGGGGGDEKMKDSRGYKLMKLAEENKRKLAEATASAALPGGSRAQAPPRPATPNPKKILEEEEAEDKTTEWVARQDFQNNPLISCGGKPSSEASNLQDTIMLGQGASEAVGPATPASTPSTNPKRRLKELSKSDKRQKTEEEEGFSTPAKPAGIPQLQTPTIVDVDTVSLTPTPTSRRSLNLGAGLRNLNLDLTPEVDMETDRSPVQANPDVISSPERCGQPGHAVQPQVPCPTASAALDVPGGGYLPAFVTPAKRKMSIFASVGTPPPSKSPSLQGSAQQGGNGHGAGGGGCEGVRQTCKQRGGEVVVATRPQLVEQDPQLESQPIILMYFKGNVKNVVYMGVQYNEWHFKKLHTTYWLAPGYKTIMLRVNHSNNMANLKIYMVWYMSKEMGLSMGNPLLTFEGRPVDRPELFNYRSGSMFILHDEEVPEAYRNHKGRLYECLVCNKACNAKKNFEKPCKNKTQHKLIFPDATPSSWGCNLDRRQRPYGCPIELDGVGPTWKAEAPVQENPDADNSPEATASAALPGGSRAQAALPGGSRAQAPPTTPRGPSRLRDQLSSITEGSPPKGAQQNTSTAPTLKPQRRTARVTRKRIQLEMGDSEEDLSTESEDEWTEPGVKDIHSESEQSDEEDKVHADADQADEEDGGKKKPYVRKWADKWREVPDTDDEEDDDEDSRLARRESRRLHRIQIAIANKVQQSAWDLPDKWVPDDEDLKLLSSMVVKPLMEQSTKWRSFHNDAPDWVKDMVLKGEMPTGKTKKAWIELASTPAMYVDGLRALLGKLQEELQKNPDRQTDKLVEGRLHLWAMLAFNTEHQISFPETVMEIIENIDSPSMQKFAFAGYKTFLQSTIKHLSSLEAKEIFNIKTVRLENMSEEEYQEKFKENSKKSKRDRVEEQQWLQQIVNNMEIGKP